MRRARTTGAALLLAAAGLIAAGCAATAVHPWDRDLVAQQKMQYRPSPMLDAVDDHIYFSREGSTGGMDAAGGGCGCN